MAKSKATFLLLLTIASGVLCEDNEGPVDPAPGSWNSEAAMADVYYLDNPSSINPSGDKFDIRAYMGDPIQVENASGDKLDIRVELTGNFVPFVNLYTISPDSPLTLPEKSINYRE